MHFRKFAATTLWALPFAFSLTGCGDAVYDTIELMPPPAVYAKGEVDPFPRTVSNDFLDETKLFYVTDRRPKSADENVAYYANERGYLLRSGTALVQADPPFSSWDEVKAVSLSLEDTPRRLLRMESVEEYGVLPVDPISLLPEAPDKAETVKAGKRFAAEIDRKLSGSSQKDIFIYVHGYNVDFDYSMLSSKELQHYLGYRGAFVTYAWPATPNRLAYFKDLETTAATRKNLRELIVFLSENTRARKIHVIGYSAGARLAFEAVYDLTLQYADGQRSKPRMGQLIMIGSELDRSYFVQALDDGLLVLADSVSVYMSTADAALRMSSLVLGEDRLGQISLEDTEDRQQVGRKLREIENLHLIDVSNAEGSSFGNGHSYFRNSPWASSDMFVSLIYNLGPAQRGLYRGPDQGIWRFPNDYDDLIVEAVKNHGG
jgi:esterase/lipase superfamily enzyme